MPAINLAPDIIADIKKSFPVHSDYAATCWQVILIWCRFRLLMLQKK